MKTKKSPKKAKSKMAHQSVAQASPNIVVVQPKIILTDKPLTIAESVAQQYSMASEMVRGVFEKELPGVVLSGERGLGKTWTTQSVVDAYDDDSRQIVKYSGHLSPLMLHNKLWEFREENCVLWFDDCDNVFTDKEGMNTLKAALDTLPKREVTWGTMSKLVHAMQFEFKGRVIITTNVKLTKSPHLAAILDRIHWFTIALTLEEKMYKIEQIASNYPLATVETVNEVVAWLKENMYKIGDLLSLRTFVKCTQLAKFSKDWRKLAELSLQQQQEVAMGEAQTTKIKKKKLGIETVDDETNSIIDGKKTVKGNSVDFSIPSSFRLSNEGQIMVEAKSKGPSNPGSYKAGGDPETLFSMLQTGAKHSVKDVLAKLDNGWKSVERVARHGVESKMWKMFVLNGQIWMEATHAKSAHK